MRAAYDDLPADVKEDLKGKIAEHWIWHSRKLAAPQEFDKPTDLEKITIPPAYHTLIQTAPDPSRMTLYVASHVRRIVGMPERESTELIRYLLNHAQQPKYQLSVQWKNVGDLVQWDNRCTMHRATAFKDQANRRDMRRTTVYDHGPYAFGAKLQLAPSQVDVLSGGLIDVAAQPAPETRTRAEIDEL
jgi:alpha-ketoglutarate-dependent 2,4-dichlorophenoxyacetate dioxygenase